MLLNFTWQFREFKHIGSANIGANTIIDSYATNINNNYHNTIFNVNMNVAG